MRAEFLECCGKVVSTGNATYTNIRKYKSHKFFKKYTSQKLEIKKEIILLTYCCNCDHAVIKFLWYVNKRDRFDAYVESKAIKGKKADKICEEYRRFWEYQRLPDPILNAEFAKQSKKLSWIYGKSNKDGLSQTPRYLDETDNAGHKIACPVRVIR